MARKKTGRPTDCTPENTARIIEAVRLGLSYEDAAAAGGVAYWTMRTWILRAEAEIKRLDSNPNARIRQNEQPFVEFHDTLRRVEHEGQLRNAALVQKAAEHDWRAAAWRLERRHPRTWGSQADLYKRVEELERIIEQQDSGTREADSDTDDASSE